MLNQLDFQNLSHDLRQHPANFASSIGQKRARRLQAAPFDMSRCSGMVRRLGSTKEIQACLLGIGQSLAIPVRLKPPQSHVDASIGKRPTASRERIGWVMRVEPLMYGKCGSRKGWAAVRICRSRHPF